MGDDAGTQPQQQTGWRNTYIEHLLHVRHRAHVPVTDGLVEAKAAYIAARDGRPCGVISDVGARGWGTDDDNMATTWRR